MRIKKTEQTGMKESYSISLTNENSLYYNESV